MRLIVGGSDAVATDHVCARLMGKNPHTVPHLRLAAKHNLGAAVYTTLGCQIDAVAEDFTFVPRWRRAWMRLRQYAQQG
jgi:uncharacterized protein (DUF362 family)